ncbi:MAG: diguanylate cyclase, partial [Xanthobacteraceae bacterium]
MARGGAVASLILALAVLACAAIGLTETQHNSSGLAAEQHAALQAAVGERQAEQFDAAELSRIARSAGLHDLRFDAALTADRGREVQSVHDAQGRIVGWFSWAPDRGFIGAMAWLWGLLGLVGIALALAAYISVRATRRLSASFARSVATIRKLTMQDPLTGLPNRRVMLERLDEAVATRGARFVAFALIDIDGFHDVDDTLGRAGGDTMLCSIAERLKAALPPGALFGRFEGDAFAAIVTGDDTGVAATLAEKLSASLAAPIYMDQSWQISASIGTAKAPDDGATGDELQRNAALALRTAKRGGRGSVRHFVPDIHVEHAERRFFLRELERAIVENAFEVHYQPVVAAEGGGMVGVEALLRWNHPTRGAIPPSLFIPLAEQSGLMIRLGEVVMRRALADGARWPSLFVAVNLSPVQIRSRELADFVAAV